MLFDVLVIGAFAVRWLPAAPKAASAIVALQATKAKCPALGMIASSACAMRAVSAPTHEVCHRRLGKSPPNMHLAAARASISCAAASRRRTTRASPALLNRISPDGASATTTASAPRSHAFSMP